MGGGGIEKMTLTLQFRAEVGIKKVILLGAQLFRSDHVPASIGEPAE